MRQSYTFDEFRVDPDERRLLRNGQTIPLPPKVFETLLLLLENSGHLVTKDEFMKRLWPNTFVGEDTLAQNISLLRRVLGGNGHEYITTVTKGGYRFEAVVQFVSRVRVDSAISGLTTTAAAAASPELRELVARRGQVRGLRISWIGMTSLCIFVALTAGLITVSVLVPAPGPKLVQLTANSVENPVTGGAISPDGKYLAYTERSGQLRIKLIATGQVQSVAVPTTSIERTSAWEIGAWLPDSVHFLANAHESAVPIDLSRWNSRDASIWIFSILGAPPQKLRDSGRAMSVSPNGSLIALATNAGPFGDREIWLMDPTGQNARPLINRDGNNSFVNLQWSPDGKLTIALQRSNAGMALTVRAVRTETPAIIHLPSTADEFGIAGYAWLLDGRLVYSAYKASSDSHCTLWSVALDAGTGLPAGPPRRIAELEDYCTSSLSASADGKRLAIGRWSHSDTTYLSDLDSRGVVKPTSVRRLSAEDYPNSAEAWTPDSTAVIFRSRRNGHTKIFKQAINSDMEQPLVMGARDVAGSALGSDGASLFYLDCSLQNDCNAVLPLMRVPVTGGTPALILKSNTYGRPRCGVVPGSACVLAEQVRTGEPLIFTTFDGRGRGRELARFATELGALYSWGLSPDASRVAVVKNQDSQIHVLSLKGAPSQSVKVKSFDHLVLVYWSADGMEWFTSSATPTAAELLRVNSQGKAVSVWEQKGAPYVYGMPSPDGRHLALVSTLSKRNIWMLEGF